MNLFTLATFTVALTAGLASVANESLPLTITPDEATKPGTLLRLALAATPQSKGRAFAIGMHSSAQRESIQMRYSNACAAR